LVGEPIKRNVVSKGGHPVVLIRI